MEAPAQWSDAVAELEEEVGRVATGELLAVTRSADGARRALDAIRSSKTVLSLRAVADLPIARDGKPWQRGARAAREARKKLGLGEGPIDTNTLAQIIDLRLPVGDVHKAEVFGAVRAADEDGSARALFTNRRGPIQRFAAARLLGMAAQLGPGDRVLALTRAKTAAQKFARSFAQEFLLPWAELDALTDEHGTDEDTIAWIAERYDVSEMVVETALVNHGKVERDRLGRFESRAFVARSGLGRPA